MNRRSFLKWMGGIVGFFVAALSIGLGFLTKWPKASLVRPPGALGEEEFTKVCMRCTRCVNICPQKAIEPAPISAGFVNAGTPMVVGRCIGYSGECLRCTKVCPTGALQRIGPLDADIGTAIWSSERCIRCFSCMMNCPANAITVGEDGYPLYDHEKCVGCGTCVSVCPVSPPVPKVIATGAKRTQK